MYVCVCVNNKRTVVFMLNVWPTLPSLCGGEESREEERKKLHTSSVTATEVESSCLT